MKNKLILISIIVIICFTLTSCTNKKNTVHTNNSNTNTVNKVKLSKPAIIEDTDNLKTETYNYIDTDNTQEKHDNLIDNSGVLIGLKKTYEDKENSPEYQTLWISTNNGEIKVLRDNSSIIAPYKYTFIRLESENFNIKKQKSYVIKESESNPYDDYEYKYKFTKIISSPIFVKSNPMYTMKLYEGHIQDSILPYKSTTEEILYVGNNYILINSRNYKTDGGTYSTSTYNNTLYEIINPGNKESKEDICNFISKNIENTINLYKNRYDKIIDDKNSSTDSKKLSLIEYIDDSNLSLERESGKWVTKIPLNKQYSHNANGSKHIYVKKYFKLPSNVFKEITSHDDLVIPFKIIKEKIPDAKDAVSSPDGKLLIILTNNALLAYINPTNNLGIPSYSIDVDEGVSIILNQWATGSYVDKWTNEFSNYFNK
jgi:hypothetical protein